jgi:basic membrane protein A
MKINKAILSLFVVLLVVTLTLGLSGCSSNGTESQDSESGDKTSTEQGSSSNKSDKILKVALITEGPVSDAGWNASAYDGLNAIKTELGAEISNLETSSPSEYEEGMRSYASQGYDIVFAHGFQFQDAAQNIGPDYPDTAFVITSGTEAFGENVSPLIFLEEEGFYIMGQAAAKLTKTNKIGHIGGMEIPALIYPYKGFEQGIKDTNPNAQIVLSWIGTWTDVGKAKEAAMAQIDNGVDVMFGSANQATQGVIQACKENNVWTFGAYSPTIATAPEIIVGEVLLNTDSAFVAVAKQVRDKTFKGGIIALGFKDDAITFNWNEDLISNFPEIKELGEQTIKDIASGKLVIPKYSLGE